MSIGRGSTVDVFSHESVSVMFAMSGPLKILTCWLRPFKTTNKTFYMSYKEKDFVAVSCGYDTCFAVKSCDGLCHFIFSIDHVELPFGFQPIIWILRN